jgi:DNA polymerase-4
MPIPGLCRDCFAVDDGPARRCPACGSPRRVEHDELHRLSIAHVDCDAFYAAIEKRDDPALRDRPVIVGGGKRGVVSTACYLARISGVRSAMPMFKALELCPDAVVVKPRMATYVAVAREVRAAMEALTPLVEPLSIDEAFLDMSGTERLHHGSPAETLARFAADIERRIGITISVGLAPNKFLAKIASDLRKPRGFAVIGAAEARTFLADKPVGLIWGVGRVAQESLAADGIRLIGDLQRLEAGDLARRYGSMGLRLARLSRGEDARSVDPHGERKSVSAETTFDDDLASLESLRPILRRLSERVADRLKRGGICGRSITLKLKTREFRILTRRRQLADPTQLADRIFRTGEALLAGEATGTRYRLIGIGVSDLVPDVAADPADLVDESGTRRARAERAVDAVRARFGDDALGVGLLFDAPRRR